MAVINGLVSNKNGSHYGITERHSEKFGRESQEIVTKLQGLQNRKRSQSMPVAVSTTVPSLNITTTPRFLEVLQEDPNTASRQTTPLSITRELGLPTPPSVSRKESTSSTPFLAQTPRRQTSQYGSTWPTTSPSIISIRFDSLTSPSDASITIQDEGEHSAKSISQTSIIRVAQVPPSPNPQLTTSGQTTETEKKQGCCGCKCCGLCCFAAFVSLFTGIIR